MRIYRFLILIALGVMLASPSLYAMARKPADEGTTTADAQSDTDFSGSFSGRADTVTDDGDAADRQDFSGTFAGKTASSDVTTQNGAVSTVSTAGGSPSTAFSATGGGTVTSTGVDAASTGRTISVAGTPTARAPENSDIGPSDTAGLSTVSTRVSSQDTNDIAPTRGTSALNARRTTINTGLGSATLDTASTRPVARSTPAASSFGSGSAFPTNATPAPGGSPSAGTTASGGTTTTTGTATGTASGSAGGSGGAGGAAGGGGAGGV